MFGGIDDVKNIAKEATGGWNGVDEHFRKKYAKEVDQKEAAAKNELLGAALAMQQRNAQRNWNIAM